MTSSRRKAHDNSGRYRGPRRSARAARGDAPARRRAIAPEDDLPPVRKLVAFDVRTWQTLDLLARDSMRAFQELADEAFRDLLKKHGRADTLRAALERSAAIADSGDGPAGRSRAGRRRRAE